MKKIAAILSILTIAAAGAVAHEGHDHDAGDEANEVTVTGEVVDMACYIDHNATGAKHADCARTCIESGLPVGLKAKDGKVYLLIGEHKPMNKELAANAAKTITVRGKLATRDGLNLLENVEFAGAASSAAVSYTCPMHPEVVSDKAGKCPKCGMNLVEKK